VSTRLRVGMGDSYGLRITVLAGPDFLPEAVTGAAFKVTKPGGELVEWAGEIGTQSALSVEALYSFSEDGLDLDTVGTWRVWIQWTVPGETPGPRSEVTSFRVVAADQL
jgi:hypothetical protein